MSHRSVWSAVILGAIIIGALVIAIAPTVEAQNPPRAAPSRALPSQGQSGGCTGDCRRRVNDYRAAQADASRKKIAHEAELDRGVVRIALAPSFQSSLGSIASAKATAQARLVPRSPTSGSGSSSAL